MSKASGRFFYAKELLKKEKDPVAWLEKMESLLYLKPEDEYSDDERHFHNAFHLDSEVENGGFIQFARNIGGDDGEIGRTIDSLRTIGLSAHAAIVQKSFDLYKSLSPEERSALNYGDKRFLAIDSEYYGISKKNAYTWQSLIEPLMAFVKKRVKSFRIDDELGQAAEIIAPP